MLSQKKINRGIFAFLFRIFMVEILKLKSRNWNGVANESFTRLQFIRPYSIYEVQAGRFQWKVWFFFFNRLFQCSESIGDKRLCLIRRRQAGFIKSRHFPTNEMGTGGLLRLFFWQNSGSVSIRFSHISNGKFLIPLTRFSYTFQLLLEDQVWNLTLTRAL